MPQAKRKRIEPKVLSRPSVTEPQRRARDEVHIEPHADRSGMELTVRRLPADARPASWSEETRTFEAIISTGAAVQRRDRRGVYAEVLDLSAVDVKALDGIPVLDNHRQGSARDVIGIIQSARLEAGAIVAKIRLGFADDIEPIAARARDGLLSVSIGYRESDRRESDGANGRIVTITPLIFEASLVGVPADRQAKLRSRSAMEPEDDIDTLDTTMSEADQARIRSLGELADLPPSWADAQIAANATHDDARAAARAAMVERTRSAPRIRVQSPAHEDPAARLRTIEEALFVRTAGGTPSDAARPFMSHTLRDIAREVLTLRGVSTTGMDADQLFRAAMHTTSDFPNLLTGVGSRILMPAYQAAQSPLRTVLARQGSRNDFRQGSTLRLGEVGALPKVNEAGEITSTSRAEAINGYALDTYASMFSISRKALINDDLGAFRDWATVAGQAAAQTEANLLWSLLSQSSGAGPTMDDGKRLFHVDHGNLAASGTNLSDTTGLAAARLALRTMKGLDGKTPIQVTPKYLLVGPARETAAEKLLASLNAATVTDVNPFAGKLTLLVEPRIATNAWYVFADPAQVPVIEYSYLASAPGPQMASREGFDVLGSEFRVVLDFGAGAVDWRGAYRDGGA